MSDVFQIDFYKEISKESGSFNERFDRVFHRHRLGTDVYLRLKSQIAELSILNGFKFTERDPLFEYIPVDEIEKFHDFNENSAISIARVQSNLRFDIEDIICNIARFSKVATQYNEANTFKLLVDRWMHGNDSPGLDAILKDEFIGAIDVLLEKGHLRKFEYTPWAEIRSHIGNHVALSALAYCQFNLMTYDSTRREEQKHNYHLNKYEAAAGYLSCCNFDKDIAKEYIEPYYSDISVDYVFRSKSAKFEFLYRTWLLKCKDGVYTEKDARLADILLLHKYNRDGIVRALRKSMHSFDTFKYFNIKTINALWHYPELSSHIEPYLPINQYNHKDLGQLLERNKCKLLPVDEDLTFFSDNFNKDLFYRILNLTDKWNDSAVGIKHVLKCLPSWLPAVDTLNNQTLTPITIECLAFLLLHEEAYVCLLDEKLIGEIGSVLPGVETCEGREKLKQEFFPNFDSIELIDDFYDTAGLIRMLVHANKKEENLNISIPEFG